MRVGVVGSEKFLGWHLRSYLLTRAGVTAVPFEDALLENQEQISDWVSMCDAVVVFLGSKNSGVEKVFRACEKNKVGPHVVGVRAGIPENSIHHEGAETASFPIWQWAKEYRGKASIITTPAVFGEFAEAGTGFVAALCSSGFMAGEESPVDRNHSLSLVYAQNLARYIFDVVKDGRAGEITVPGRNMTEGEVYDMVKYFRDEYREGAIPRLKDEFAAELFGTLRSYLLDGFYPKKLALKTDERGILFEIARDKTGGQTSFSLTKPGYVRGNHYHIRKIERFCVVQGEAEIRIRRILTDQNWVYRVRGDEPVFIDMPRFCTHNLKNIGAADMLTVFWTNECYDPEDPDTYRDIV